MSFLLALLMSVIPANEFQVIKHPITVQAEVTKYNATESQTDSTPTTGANGREVNQLTAACPVWLPFGTAIRVDGQFYICQDRMAVRYRQGNYFDLIADTYAEAVRFGRQSKLIEIIL